MIAFDIRNTIIPFSLLQISNHYRKMQPGEIMEIVGGDRAFSHMVRKVLPTSDCEIISDERQNQDSGERKVLIRVIKNIS